MKSVVYRNKCHLTCSKLNVSMVLKKHITFYGSNLIDGGVSIYLQWDHCNRSHV